MIKKILFIIFIISIIPNICIAGVGSDSGYSFDGNGLPEYPNEGSMWASCYGEYWSNQGAASADTATYDTDGNLRNYYYTGHSSLCNNGASNVKAFASTTSHFDYAFSLVHSDYTSQCLTNSSYTEILSTTANRIGGVDIISTQKFGIEGRYANAWVRVTVTENNVYNVSGVTGCVSDVSLYYLGNEIDSDDNLTATNNYEFEHLIDGKTYTLNFSDGHSYEFTVSGSDITYDYDACITTKYKFLESCNNLIPDSEGFYIEKIGDVVHAANYFHAPSGVLTIYESPANNIYISTSPFSGQIGWFLDSIVNETTYNLTNPYIAWSLKVIVQNESDGTLIDDAMVKVDQDCYCTAGYSTRQKLTVNGVADFTDMSLQDASLWVYATGYKICDENTTGYDVFLSGRTNFSSKTWIVKLAPSESENVSTFYEVNNTVNIYFRDINGNRTSKILDTDSELYLYYENNNTNEEAMTLKFQSSSTHSYFNDELSWSIPHDSIGHKTIANSYFTPWDYSYRATIYNSTIYGWNRTIPLTVRNATKETTEHYENLTTYLYFMGASDGRIDYREDMWIGIHACSNNTTLMNVDIELYKNNSLLCYKNITASDFINADFPYWYMWSPIYDYESGANYSVRMFGFDRTLLETDYVECITDTIIRKNKLTIIVKNRFGTNLNNAFVYLEGYGSLPIGTNYYASYEGLDNGYYRFKATKPGYEAAGWDDVTISDSDEIRTYTLTESTSEAATANQPIKANDDALRNLYIMLMSFLLIFILFGGFLYVAK